MRSTISLRSMVRIGGPEAVSARWNIFLALDDKAKEKHVDKFKAFKWLLTSEQKNVLDEMMNKLVRDARCESLGTVAIKNAGEDEGADPFDDEVPHKSASSSSSFEPSSGPKLDDFVVILGLTGCQH